MKQPVGEPSGGGRGGPEPLFGATLDRRGLCPGCAHVRRVEGARGSSFLSCSLSRSDARFPRYPAQPRMVCSGWRR